MPRLPWTAITGPKSITIFTAKGGCIYGQKKRTPGICFQAGGKASSNRKNVLHDETGFAPVNKTWSINLTGTATLDIEVNYFGSGIRAHEDVDIEKLTLNINVNKTDDITDEYGGGKFSEAIRANDTLTIENGVTVNVNSVSGTGPIYSENGDLVINDATVNVTSLAGIELSDGSKLGANPIISYGDVIISGNSNVTAKGYFGICGNNIQISGNAVVDSTSTVDSAFWVPTGK